MIFVCILAHLYNVLNEETHGKQSDFDIGVNEGAKRALNYITTGDQHMELEMERVEVKTDYSTMGDHLELLVNQYQDDDESYLCDVQEMFDIFIENLNNFNLIDITSSTNKNHIDNNIKLNEYKRSIVYGLMNIGFFIETLENVEKLKNDVFDSSNIDNAILDITDAYYEFTKLKMEILSNSINVEI